MDFQELIQKRRSIRSYSAEKKVTKEQLEEIIKAAQLAPTWKNSQTGRYYAAVSEEAIADVRKALPEFNQNSSKGAALIVTTFVKGVSGFGDGKPANEIGDEWGAYDLGLQNAYLVLKASDLGLDTLIMGIRDADALRKTLSIPETEEVVAVIAVGYRGKDPVFGGRKELEEIAKFS